MNDLESVCRCPVCMLVYVYAYVCVCVCVCVRACGSKMKAVSLGSEQRREEMR